MLKDELDKHIRFDNNKNEDENITNGSSSKTVSTMPLKGY
jgi:hypothetical protein